MNRRVSKQAVRRCKKLPWIFLIGVLLGVGVVVFLESTATQDGYKDFKPRFLKVESVIDGDTIRLENGSLVRYIGINAPETHHPRQAKQCFGDEATEFNKGLVAGRAVRLEKDVSDEDKYGRKLRFVFLEDGRMVNLELVRRGFAKTMSIPPDISKADVFKKVERQAQQKKLGLWSACSS